jgi:hypothetical protein
VYALDKEQPVTAVMTLDRLLQDSQYARPRFNLVLLSIFATFGFVLAAVGIYGIMSTAVAQEYVILIQYPSSPYRFSCSRLDCRRANGLRVAPREPTLSLR